MKKRLFWMATFSLSSLCALVIQTVPAHATTTPTFINGKIAFVNYTPSFAEIWTIKPDGTDATKILAESISGLASSPSWSPNGKKITYNSSIATPGTADIYIMDADGTGKTNITNTPTVREEAPSWSPDGTKIAYASDSGLPVANYRLWVMNADGTNQVNISDPSSQLDRTPSWSPDGSTIYYSSVRSGTEQTYAYNINTNTDTQISHFSASALEPSVSPDGLKVLFAYAGPGDTKLQLYTQDSDGNNLTKLSQLCSNEWSQYPTWSPDGKQVAFLSACDATPNGNLYAMNADGTNRRRLTTATDNDWTPISWQRVPVTSSETDNDGTEIDTVGDDKSDQDYDVSDNTKSNKVVFVVNGKVGQVNVNSNGVLKGHGTIVMGVTVKPGGKLAPGNSPGCISSGGLTFNSGSTYEVEIAGNTVCTEYDQTVVTGAVDLGSATLNTLLLNNFVGKQNDTFKIIDNDGSDPVNGTFNGLAEGATFTVGGTQFKISYIGGDGNDVVLTIQNSPTPKVPNTGLNLILSNPIITLAITLASVAGIARIARRVS